MIYTAAHLAARGARLRADACVVGSGAGGAAAAAELAAGGLSVVLLEAGSCIFPEAMNQREVAMLKRLFWEQGGRATSDQAVKVHQGRGLGGSTLHNLNLCKRLPAAVAAHWREAGAERYVAGLEALYPEVERRLAVSPMQPRDVNRNNRLLQRGCEALGYRGGLLAHNRRNCVQSGFCLLGCAFDAKQNALKVFIPQAVEHGAKVLANTFALRLERDGPRIRRLHARVQPEGQGFGAAVEVEAGHFLLAASATGTPALLERSGLPDPHGQRGRHLRLHPGVVAAGVFPEPVEGWKGIPQSYECTEFLRYTPEQRVWIAAAFAHPVGTASEIPGFGARHAAFMKLYPRLAVLTAMLHDESEGTVRARGTGVALDYWPDAADRAQLRLGWKEMARILFAAGASRVLIPWYEPLELSHPGELEKIDGLTIAPHTQNITAVHPMGSARLGEDPTRAVVDPSGRHHQVENLWVCDTSVFPSSIGVPPQLTTYATGLYVARELLRAGS